MLVELEPTHLEAVRGWLADDDLRDRVGTLHHPTADEHRRWYGRLLDDPTRLARLIVDDTGRPLGLCGYQRIEPAYRCAEVWIYLGAEDTRRSGVGSGALRELLALGFDQLDLHRVEARVFGFNEPARHFFLSHGFVEEGADRDGVFKRGAFHDVWRFGLLETEHRG